MGHSFQVGMLTQALMAMVILQIYVAFFYIEAMQINIVTLQVAYSNHTELSALCQGWLRGQGGPSEALMIAIQVT